MKFLTRSLSLLILLSIIWLPPAHAKAPLTAVHQTGTLTFDNTNSTMGCAAYAFIQQDDTGEHELTMILSPSTSYMDVNPTQYAITFNFDQGTITGNMNTSLYQEEDHGAYDSADLYATIANGTVTWDTAQGVWIFGGAMNTEVYLDILNVTGSVGDEIFYGEAHLKTIVAAQIIGASGEHKRIDHHGEEQIYGDDFIILFDGDDLPAEGSGALDHFDYECWLKVQFPEALEDYFPPDPYTNLPEDSTEDDETTDDEPGQEDEQTTGDTEVDDFLDMDLNDQLGLFIATYGTDPAMLHQWPGWENLTDTQRNTLETLIDKLDTILALQAPLSPLALSIMEGEKRQEVLAQQAADLVQEELDIRKNVRDTVWVETLRDKFGDNAVYLYENYQVFQDVKGVYDAGVGWINNIQDPDTAATEKVKQDALSAAGADKTPEDIAKDAIQHINTIATAPSVYHYAFYREIYDTLINNPDETKRKTPTEAHQIAMDALRQRVNDYAAGEYGDPNDQLEQHLWGPAVNAALKPAGIYDTAFPQLNDQTAPQVTP